MPETYPFRPYEVFPWLASEKAKKDGLSSSSEIWYVSFGESDLISARHLLAVHR